MKYIGLAPCPFCGNDVEIMELHAFERSQKLSVFCKGCGAEVTMYAEKVRDIWPQGSVIDKWDRRVPDEINN